MLYCIYLIRYCLSSAFKEENDMEVYLREWMTSDAFALSEILNEKDMHKFMRDLPFPYSVTDASWYINQCLNADKDRLYSFAIVADGKLAGCISALRGENIKRMSAEVGYYVKRELWGRGVATAALKQLVRYIMENTDIVRLYSTAFSENIASCKVLKNCGFEYEGTLVKAVVKYGKLHDEKVYALIRQ